VNSAPRDGGVRIASPMRSIRHAQRILRRRGLSRLVAIGESMVDGENRCRAACRPTLSTSPMSAQLGPVWRPVSTQRLGENPASSETICCVPPGFKEPFRKGRPWPCRGSSSQVTTIISGNGVRSSGRRRPEYRPGT